MEVSQSIIKNIITMFHEIENFSYLSDDYNEFSEKREIS